MEKLESNIKSFY